MLLISLDQNVSILLVNNVYWEYKDILTQKVIHEDLLKCKTFVYFGNFSCLVFEFKMSQYTQAQK